MIFDPAEVRLGGKPRPFFYERVGTDHYYLLSVGRDGKPFTADDIVPQVDPATSSKLGLLIKPLEHS
jgi:hypothetical protein